MNGAKNELNHLISVQKEYFCEQVITHKQQFMQISLAIAFIEIIQDACRVIVEFVLPIERLLVY
jgi:hypothetical protein